VSLTAGVQLRRFLSVGVVNAGVGLSIIYTAKWLFAAGDITANAIGYAVGLSISFALNSRWTFAFRGGQWQAFGKFLAMALLAYAGNLVTVLFAIRTLGINDYIAQAMGLPVYTLILFLTSKYLVFRAAPAARGRA
jgi:putative flippase GtrA